MTPRPEIVFRDLAGTGAVLFDRATSRIAVLDRPEALAWCLIAEHGIAHAAPHLAEAAGLEPASARAWLRQAAEGLADLGLLGPPARLPPPETEHAARALTPAGRIAIPRGLPRRRYRLSPNLIVEVVHSDEALAEAAAGVLGHLETAAPAPGAPLCAVLPAPEGFPPGWVIALDGEVVEHAPRAAQRLPALKVALARLALDRAGAGRAAVHAAAVAAGGMAVLLPAPAGSGKSTLAAAAMLAGWELLADDTVILGRQGRLVHPLPFAICLKRGSWDVLRAAGATTLDSLPVHERLDGREARYLAPPAAARVARRLGAIVVPAWRPGTAPRLRRLAPPEALRALLPQYFPIGAALDGEAIGRAASLVTGLACFELSYDALADGVRLLGEVLAP
jgi:hypothetical protein